MGYALRSLRDITGESKQGVRQRSHYDKRRRATVTGTVEEEDEGVYLRKGRARGTHIANIQYDEAGE